MEIIRLSKPDRTLHGSVTLDGSKSLSNRALIILALAGADPATWLNGLSSSKDSQTLLQLLSAPGDRYDAGDAGTTFRFLTAYLALQPGTQELTGSARMRERPIDALVRALLDLGADISYLEKEGYPPLRIGPPIHLGKRTVRINASVSSQFLSALLLIGPYLPNGLVLIPEGLMVSSPYLDMTIKVMQHFGALVYRQVQAIVVEPKKYQPTKMRIEADWSAASYWYAMAAFAEKVDLTLVGLFRESWQGDAVLASQTQHSKTPKEAESPPALRLKFDRKKESAFFDDTSKQAFPINLNFSKGQGAPLPFRTGETVTYATNFYNCPDIAQTLAVVHAGLGIPAVFTGLQTLAIKETDRTAALATELAKVGVQFGPKTPESMLYVLRGKANWSIPPRFSTYGDHRMAMAFAPLAMLGPIEIEDPGVVAKSYPAFWDHLEQVGFLLEKIDAP